MRTHLTRNARRALSSLLAVTVGAGGLVAVAAAAAPVAVEPVSTTGVVGGSLDWGVKASFRTYITGPIAHGAIEVREPATSNDDGTFRFAEGSGVADGEAGAADVAFAGEVYFSGHDSGSGPLLEVTVTDPAIRVDGAEGVLIADVASLSLDSGELVEYPDVELAELDLSSAPLTVDGDTVTATGVPATLTAAGVPAFANFYAAGTALDPVSFTVTVEETEPEPVWEPALEVYAADGETPLGDTELNYGDTVVVRGSGYDPAGNVAPEGSRPPIPAGVPAGTYVVFGKFADDWRPSQGAASSARVVGSQLWALAEGALNQVPSQYQGAIRAQWVPIGDDGAFTAELTIAQPADRTTGEPVPWPETGTFGVYTYAAGGTVNAEQERAVPVTVAEPDTEPEPEPEPEPGTGALDWGVKASFRNYITGPIAHGSVEVREPATQNADGTFRFGSGSGDESELTFAGEVYFAGHDMGSGPLLELTVTDPRVSVSGSSGVLVADVASKSLSSGELVTYDDVELADLDFSEHPVAVVDGVVSAAEVPATLTADGVAAFADFYAAGTELDPVTFSVELGDEPPAPAPIVTVSKTENLDPYADQITVTGTGFAADDLTDGLRVGIGELTGDGVPALDPVEVVAVAPAAAGSFEVTLATGQVEPGTTLAVHTSPVHAEADAAYTTQTPISFAEARTPELTVTPTDDLEPGSIVEVSGTGFAPNRKISIAFTPNTEQHPEYGWPTGWLHHGVVQADAAGNLARTVTVAGTVTGTGVDCRVSACFLAAFSSAQASDATPVDYRADRSQDVVVPVTFAADGPDPEPEAAVAVAPETVAPGETVTFDGTGYGAEEEVEATIQVDAAASYTFGNDNGQSLTVSSGDANPLVRRDGKLLVVDGGELSVTLDGLEPNTPDAPAGFYLLTAVDNGAGNLATPAIGGADTSGGSGTSRWITNVPYPGSEDLVVPITDGSASTSISLVAADEFADCTTATDGCVLYLRTDHRSAANRTFDVRVPLEFVTIDELAEASEVEPVTLTATTDADGAVGMDWTVPADTPAGAATVTLTGTSSGRSAAARFTVTEAPPGTDDGGSDSGTDSGSGTDGGTGGDGGSDSGPDGGTGGGPGADGGSDGGAGAGGSGGSGGDDLPDTGAGAGPVLAIGLALIAGGLVVALLDRRRRTA